MFSRVPLFHPLFSLWTGRPWAIRIIFLYVYGKHLTKKTNLFRQKYFPFSRYAENQMHGGAVSGKGGFSLVPVYCSEIHWCARSNITVVSNVTEVPSKHKFWVNIMTYLLWNRITVLRKVENELLYKWVYLPPLQVYILTYQNLERNKKDLYIRNI